MLALCLCLSFSANAQTAKFSGTSLIISDGQKRIQLHDIIAADAFARCVHAVQKRNGDYFLLTTVGEWSRGAPPRNGFCGAGRENYLEWFQVHDGKITTHTKVLYASCFDNRDGRIIGWRDKIFTAQVDYYLEHSDQKTSEYGWKITYTFDANKPEAGIKEVKTELKAE